MSTCHEWHRSPGGRFTTFRSGNKWKAELDVLAKYYITYRQQAPWEPWPEGIETIEDMKAYIETLDRMGEL